MFAECVKNNGIPYLRLMEGYRATNKNGDRVSRKRLVFSIGPLSRYDDGKPDYVERLKKSFEAGTPLISSLERFCQTQSQDTPKVHNFSVTEGSPDCFGHPKIFSHILLEHILEELGLNTFFSSYKRLARTTYDVYGFAKLLIFDRLLNPVSKGVTVRQNQDYYEPVLGEHNPDNVYDTLDFIYDNKDKIIRRINTNLVKKEGRSPEIIYYGVTSFCSGTDNSDEDVLDEDGNIIGNEICLFMDDSGIPIAIESFPGNTPDHLSMRTALAKNIDGMDSSRFVLVSDRVICCCRNLLRLKNAGNGYIVSKSLLKSTKEEQDWAYSDDGYISAGTDFRYKSRIVKKKVKDENGNVHDIEEKVVVYRSRKFQARAEAENKKFLEFLEKLEAHPENFRLTATQSKSLRKFFKKECLNEKTGEILDSTKIRALIDFNKVAQYRKSLGYYQIVTSELTMDAQEDIDKYHELTRIENQFHVMKRDLNTRPFYVRTTEHITAHMMICLIALIMLRIIQKRIVDSEQIALNPNAYWSSGLNASRIQQALLKWKLDMLPGDLYRFMDVDDLDLKLILDSFGIEIPAKLYRRAELKHIKTTIKVFI